MAGIPEIGMWAAIADVRAVAADARLFESLGFPSIWTGEHNDAMVQSGALAVSTDRAILGTAIAQISRTPAQMALGCMAMQSLTGGRYRLGLGMGGRGSWVGWHNLPWERRSQRFAEYVRAVRALQAVRPGAPASFHGDFYHVDGFATLGHHDAPPAPIWTAAGGNRAFWAAGSAADGVFIINLMPPRHFRDVAFPIMAKAAQEAGRDPAAITQAFVRYVAVDEDGAWARNQVRAAIARSALSDYHRAILSASGFGAELKEIAAAAERKDPAAAAAAVSDRLLATVGLAGSPAQLRDQVRAAGEYAQAILVHTANGGLGDAQADEHNRAVGRALAPLNG